MMSLHVSAPPHTHKHTREITAQQIQTDAGRRVCHRPYLRGELGLHAFYLKAQSFVLCQKVLEKTMHFMSSQFSQTKHAAEKSHIIKARIFTEINALFILFSGPC